MAAPRPPQEEHRLATLKSYEILDTPRERAFDRVTSLAARIFDVPMVLVSLVDDGRQWFKSSVGVDVCETSRDVAFCAHAILQSEPLVVEDATLDARFADSPLVVGGPMIRFYAGAPLTTACGANLGTLCIADVCPRELDDSGIEMLAELAAVVVDSLELRRASVALELLAVTDALTSIANKRALSARLEQLVAEGERGRSFALVMVDIDNFKSFNDRYGHETGDIVLRSVAQAMSRRARKVDFVARYGGEELCLLVVDVDAQTACAVAEDHRRAIEQLAGSYPVTASFGVAVNGPATATASAILRAADVALYEAKAQGRNRVVLAMPTLARAA